MLVRAGLLGGEVDGLWWYVWDGVGVGVSGVGTERVLLCVFV